MNQDKAEAPVDAPIHVVPKAKPKKRKAAPAAKKERPKRFLPTDRIGFLKQLDLLRAWAAASGPDNRMVTNNDVAAIVGLSASTIALANPFFADVGFLQKMDGGFVPAQDVVSFARAYEWNPETATHKLAPIVTESWFGKALSGTLAFRAMDEREAIQALADAISAGPDFEDQLRTVLSFMQAAGVLQQEGQQVRQARPSTSPTPAASPSPPQPAAEPREGPQGRSVTTAFTQAPEGILQFHVSVRVDMKEFVGWQPDRISRFFEGIAAVLRAKSNIEKDASET